MRFRLRRPRLFRFRFLRKPKLPPPAETEAAKTAEESPSTTSAEFRPYVPAVPAVEAQPEQAPVIETLSDSPATLPPATIPRTLPPPYPDEWMRARAMYFAPATYSPSPSIHRVLAPDLLFRLGVDTRRVITEARTPPQAEPPPPPPPATKPLPRLMDDFTTSGETEPQANTEGRVVNVDPLLLTLFLSAREAASEVPPQATTEYLTEPALLAHGIELRDRVVRHWSRGGPPLSALAFYQMARLTMPHPGTALLLCHNVAKAFARRGEAIRWQVTNRTRGEYTDGESAHLAALLHRDGALKTGPFANPSIFYVLFSTTDFGATDPGDYYRFFAAAAAVWYAASNQTRVPVLPPSHAAEQMAQSFVDIVRQMVDRSLELTPAYRGWLWANAMRLPLRGARFGLREAGEEPDPAWTMHPIAAQPDDLHLSRATIAQILATGSPHIRRDFAGASFTLLCTVEEGAACRFTSSDWADQSLAPLALGIIEDLGWNAVEHSASRQVVVRCTVLDSDPAKARCECDRGGGFQPLALA